MSEIEFNFPTPTLEDLIEHNNDLLLEKTLQKIPIVQPPLDHTVACNNENVVCITENGKCYKWYNQLYSKQRNINYPTISEVLLPNNEKAKSVACGLAHTVIVTLFGNIYTWGQNYIGQLGLGDYNYRKEPTLLLLPNNEKAKYVVCGINSTICITEINTIYVWGNNQYGQLGLGHTSPRNVPTLLTLPNNEKVKYVSMNDHTIFMTENERTYVCGRNNDHQLCSGTIGYDEPFYSSPRLYDYWYKQDGSYKLNYLTCGSGITYLVHKKRKCYMCGSGLYGQTASKQENTKFVTNLDFALFHESKNFERVEYFKSNTFYITSNGYHSVALIRPYRDHIYRGTLLPAYENICFTWGNNDHGQLGYPNQLQFSDVPYPFQLPNNERVAYPICSPYHTILISKSGKCYVLGTDDPMNNDAPLYFQAHLILLPNNEKVKIPPYFL